MFTLFSSDKNKKIMPSNLKLEEENGKKILVDKNTASRYEILSELQGRGQAGVAYFIKKQDSNEVLLIKEDDAATCMMEGTAGFVKDLIPYHLKNSVNLAEVSALEIANELKVASIQKRVSPASSKNLVKPWDVLVYGCKRNPNTIISYEALYNNYIKSHLENLSSDAEWSIAAAVFSSVLSGDESLHIAQFMAEVDNKNNILNVTRIDLGARERFAVKRSQEPKDNWDPFSTSACYKSSGQFGKDYLGYIFQSDSIKYKYMLMFFDMELDAKKIEEIIIKQFNKIPENKKVAALQGMLQTINKGYKEAEKIDINSNNVNDMAIEVAKQIATLDVARFERMKRIAKKAFKSKLEDLSEELNKLYKYQENFYSEIIRYIQKNKFNAKQLENYKNNLDENIKNVLVNMRDDTYTQEQLKKIINLNELKLQLLEQEKFALFKSKEDISQNLDKINNQIKQSKTIDMLSNYLLVTKSEEKKSSVIELLKISALGKEGGVKEFLMGNDEFIKKMMKFTSYVGLLEKHYKTSKGSEVILKLLKMYDLDFLELAKLNNAKACSLLIKNTDFNIDEIYSTDENGKSALYYLAEMLKNNKNKKDVIKICGKIFAHEKFYFNLAKIDTETLNIMEQEKIISKEVKLSYLLLKYSDPKNIDLQKLNKILNEINKLTINEDEKIIYNATNEDGSTFLHNIAKLAVRPDGDQYAKFLYELIKNNDVIARAARKNINSDGDTILHLLASSANQNNVNSFIKILKKSIENIGWGKYLNPKSYYLDQITNNEGFTPIHIALNYGNNKLIKELNQGIDVETKVSSLSSWFKKEQTENIKINKFFDLTIADPVSGKIPAANNNPKSEKIQEAEVKSTKHRLK